MSFELDPKPDDIFYERKQHAHVHSGHASERTEDPHKDLFETISEAHYLPELGGPHDEALLESLVEKGCEDNHILGHTLDKLAHLVEYEEEDDMLLGAAPVSDIIDRLESLESPGRSSMTAVQGLLHLHQLTEHLPQTDLTQHTETQPYLSENMFVPNADESTIQTMHEPQSETNDVNHVQYEQNSEVRLEHKPIEYSQNGEVGLDESHVQYDQNGDVVLENNHVEYDQSAEIAPRIEEIVYEPSTEVTLDDSHTEYEQSAENRIDDDMNETVYSDISEDPAPDNENDHHNAFEEHPPPPPEPDPEPAIIENPVANQEQAQEKIAEAFDPEQVVVKTEVDIEQDLAMAETEPIDPKEIEGVELVATDLSINSLKPKNTEKRRKSSVVATAVENTNSVMESMLEKNEEVPKDLTVHRRYPTPHASPRRIDIPRAPSRESDAMQSPQPSGIPAVPSSPEIFTVPMTKSKQALFLESLLSSPSPKMYTSEVTISKQQFEPMNLGKHRKSASPTVSSCSDEIRKPTKDYGEPQEKRVKDDPTEDLAKISKVLNTISDEQIPDSAKRKTPETWSRIDLSSIKHLTPLEQVQAMKKNKELRVPDPLLIPKDRLNDIVASPCTMIPAIIEQHPEFRLPEAFSYPNIVQDPDIFVVTLTQIEEVIKNNELKILAETLRERQMEKTSSSNKERRTSTSHTESTRSSSAGSHPKPIPSMDALAGDIDAATSAALNQMLWLPYLSQLEAMAACSQNVDFMKALSTSGYTGSNYPDVSQMFNPTAAAAAASRGFAGQAGFPMMPPMDYDNRLQFAMWQEAMNNANAAAATQRAKPSSLEAHMKDLAKSLDVQNPFVHSTKSHQIKSHSAARTSPITHNYNSNQRGMPHNPYLQGMYPGMVPNMRPGVPLPGLQNLQIPYFNPNLMSQRSPRTGQQKSPSSPFYPNNNYLQSKPDSNHSHSQHQRRSSSSSQESPRPRISVKSLHNLLEPSTSTSSSSRRHSSSSHSVVASPAGLSLPSAHAASAAALSRRRDDTEVGSTTPLGEPLPLHMPPNPHDPASFHLWHPLFGNQKGYASPWNWTTVTATGD